MMKIRVSPTGLASEAWRIERDGVHVGDVTLTIHATGWGEYKFTRWDRPDLVALRAQLVRDGSFAFDVWDRAAVTNVLAKVLHDIVREGVALDVQIRRPTR
jgi:hypothetical protein